MRPLAGQDEHAFRFDESAGSGFEADRVLPPVMGLGIREVLHRCTEIERAGEDRGSRGKG